MNTELFWKGKEIGRDCVLWEEGGRQASPPSEKSARQEMSDAEK
jgi:hypothetical protein